MENVVEVVEKQSLNNSNNNEKVTNNSVESENSTPKITSNEKDLRLKIEKEIREKLEKEAQLSAEEKLNERIKELETEKKTVVLSKNKVSAEQKFAKSGFQESDYKDLLDFIVSEDEETTLKCANSIIQAIENAADRKIKNTMVGNAGVHCTPHSKTVDECDLESESFAKVLGKTRSESHKSAMDIIKKYTV